MLSSLPISDAATYAETHRSSSRRAGFPKTGYNRGGSSWRLSQGDAFEKEMAMVRTMIITLVALVLGLVAVATPSQAAPLFPMKTGMTLIYNSSNTSGQTWHMTQQVLEQVTFNNKQYFRVRETNYYPNSGVDFDGYMRCTDTAAYAYDGATGEFIAFQIGNVGTTGPARVTKPMKSSRLLM
jgi:hypothetical protein